MIGELHKGRVTRGNGQNTFHVGNLSVRASTTKSLGMSNMELAFSDINYLAVLAGVVVNMVAGALRYSPLLFANPWMAETGISMEQFNENPSLAFEGCVVSIFASVIIVITLAMIVQLTGASTAAEGVLLGLLAGVGFVAATQLPNYMFESRSLKIYVINVGYPVVTFTTIGLLLTVWQ